MATTSRPSRFRRPTTSGPDEPATGRSGRRARLLAPLGGLAALATRFGSLGGGESATLGHHGAAAAKGATVLGHHAAGGATAHAGAEMGIAAGTGATGIASAGSAGAAAAVSSPPPAPAAGIGSQAVIGVGAVAATAMVALGVIAVTRNPDPVTEQPQAATTTAAPALEPAAGPVVYATGQSELLAATLLASGAVGPDGQPVTVQAVQDSPDVGIAVALGSGAEITAQADGSFTYDPGDAFTALDEGETGSETFVYTVADGAGWSEQRTATITVTGANDKPVFAALPPVSVVEQESSSLGLAATDPEGHELTYSLDGSAPSFVSLGETADGGVTLVLTPSSGEAGSYRIVVTVNDSGSPALSSTMPVAVTVGEAPKAVTAPAAPEQRVSDRLAALYDFAEGTGSTVTSSMAAVDSAPPLAIADPEAVSWGTGSLEVHSPTLITSNGPAGSLIASIIQSNEVTLEAWVTASNTEQAGPARIMSLSSDIGSRNATLAQGEPDGIGGDRWTARLRSTTTTTNGLPALVTPPGTASSEATHLVLTGSSAGELRLYVDGELQASEVGVGDLSNWDAAHPLVLANEFDGNRPWLGTYHLVAVYDKALSQAEVAQNHRVGP